MTHLFNIVRSLKWRWRTHSWAWCGRAFVDCVVFTCLSKTFLPGLVSGFQMPWLFNYVQLRGIQPMSHVSNAVHFYFNIHFPNSKCLAYPISNIKKTTLSHIFKIHFCILGSNLTLVTVWHIADTQPAWISVSNDRDSFASASLLVREHFLHAFCVSRTVCIGLRSFIMCVSVVLTDDLKV